MAAFRAEERTDSLGSEAPPRPEDVADLVRVLEALEPLSQESAPRPRLGAAAAFWA
ncbi:MAG: hypothetical protein QNJ30_16150 [Kiloniellales bacterium]|nr:hypothetical protein [Kiloniellales bacterium]